MSDPRPNIPDHRHQPMTHHHHAGYYEVYCRTCGLSTGRFPTARRAYANWQRITDRQN